MKRYEAYDDYEGTDELLGSFDTKREAVKACKRRDDETDGECKCRVVEVEG